MPGEMPFAAAREAQLDRLGDLVAENVDRESLVRLIEDGPPFGLPVVSHRLSAVSGGRIAVGYASGAEASAESNGQTAPNSSTFGLSSRGAAGEGAIKLKADS